MSLAALMTLVGGFFQRYDLVVAGQQVPVYLGWNNLPDYLGYVPSTGELLVVMGGLGVCATLFLLGERFFGRAFKASAHH